ncbi:integrase [Kosakonia radicincitans UMEnt01/12]|nr:integrase [Kosakonia radicincitans UMEnt01/12]
MAFTARRACRQLLRNFKPSRKPFKASDSHGLYQ